MARRPLHAVQFRLPRDATGLLGLELPELGDARKAPRDETTDSPQDRLAETDTGKRLLEVLDLPDDGTLLGAAATAVVIKDNDTARRHAEDSRRERRRTASGLSGWRSNKPIAASGLMISVSRLRKMRPT